MTNDAASYTVRTNERGIDDERSRVWPFDMSYDILLKKERRLFRFGMFFGTTESEFNTFSSSLSTQKGT